MTKLTQSRVDAIKAWFTANQPATDQRFKEFVKAIAHGIEGHGHRFTGGPGDTAGDAAGVWNIQAGPYNDIPSLPKQGDLYIAFDQCALLGCFTPKRWTTIASCRTHTPVLYAWWPISAHRYVYFHAGIPPDILVFAALYPGTYRWTYEPRAVQSGPNVYAIWYTLKTDVSRYRVLFSTSSNWGFAFSDPIVLSDEAGQPDLRHRHPDLALDAFGNLHATWVTYWTGDPSILYYTKSLDHGKTWSTPVQVANDVPRPPRIAVHILSSYIVILSKTTAGNLFVYRSEDGGKTWGSKVWIPGGGSPYQSGADYDLRFVGNVLYGASTDGNRVHAFRSLDYGKNWTVWPRQLSGTLPYGYDPPAIHARAGKLWIVYPYYTTELQNVAAVDVMFTLDDCQTWKWARIFYEDGYIAQRPSIDLWGGTLHATWLSTQNEYVHRSVSKDSGLTWGARTTLIDPVDPGSITRQVIAEQFYTA